MNNMSLKIIAAPMSVYGIYLLFKKLKKKIKILGLTYTQPLLLGLIFKINPYFMNILQGRNHK